MSGEKPIADAQASGERGETPSAGKPTLHDLIAKALLGEDPAARQRLDSAAADDPGLADLVADLDRVVGLLKEEAGDWGVASPSTELTERVKAAVYERMPVVPPAFERVMLDPDLSTNRRRRTVALITGLAVVALFLLLLYLAADPSEQGRRALVGTLQATVRPAETGDWSIQRGSDEATTVPTAGVDRTLADLASEGNAIRVEAGLNVIEWPADGLSLAIVTAEPPTQAVVLQLSANGLVLEERGQVLKTATRSMAAPTSFDVAVVVSGNRLRVQLNNREALDVPLADTSLGASSPLTARVEPLLRAIEASDSVTLRSFVVGR